MEAGNKRSRQLFYRSFATFAVFLARCFVPFAYPRLSHIPSVPINDDDKSVHAFRVSANIDRIDFGTKTDFAIEEVPITPAGHIPPQNNLSLDRGFYVIGIALNYPIHHSHLIRLRIYKPGCQIVELTDWQRIEKLTWIPAPDLAEQEKAVDDLLNPSAFRGDRNTTVIFLGQKGLFDFPEAPPGSLSPRNREALRFIASEYERLGQITQTAVSDDATARDRLQRKAATLRELAEK